MFEALNIITRDAKKSFSKKLLKILLFSEAIPSELSITDLNVDLFLFYSNVHLLFDLNDI